MSIITHVFGPAAVLVDVDGAGLVTLGYTVDGVTLTDTLVKKEVLVDTYGETPYDVQYMLSKSEVEMDLAIWDWDTLNSINGYVNATPGTFGPAGTLFGQNGQTFRLLIRSTPSGTGVTGVEACRNYPSVFLDESASAKVGTERSVYKLKFYALPAQIPSSSNDVVLYNTVCS
jgi:hypothetical protein